MHKRDLKTPGEHLEITSRRLGYFLKCPLRASLSKDKETTQGSFLEEEILDSCMNHLLVKEIAGFSPSIKSVMDHAAELVNQRIADIHKQSTLDSIGPILARFHKTLPEFRKNNDLVFPPFEMNLTMHGVTIKLLVNIGIKARTSGLPITRYVFFDYSTTKNPTWNIYPRLWACAAKMSLAEQGVTTIETGILNIPSGKYVPIRYSTNTRVNPIIADACIAYAAHMEYPVFGGHCYSCVVKEQCAQANSV